MSTICRLVQGGAEWHEHRRKYRNASETPIVLGVSPWVTPYQLWQHKLGLVEPEVNRAMLRGTELEPTARAAYEARTGHVMQPLVMVDGEYSASLDGVTLGGERLVEIKCPYKGRASALWQAIEAGEVPEHYGWQVQHQLMVTGAQIADVFVFDGHEGISLEVRPAPGTWPQIRAAWDAFTLLLRKQEAPPLSDRDVRVRDDAEWLNAAASYLELRAASDAVSAKYDAAKARLLAMVAHPKEEGGGVCVTRFWRRGNVDYKRVPELAGLDLEKYRAKSREGNARRDSAIVG